jgi:hypothetical protein
MVELGAVATALVAVVALRHGPFLEWLSAAAVLASFAHGQVSSRLAEQEGARARPSVECWKWSTRYFVMKEAFWAAFFFASGAYSALVGVALFLAYPAWRAWWRRRRVRA